MENEEYEITGRVITETKNQGIANLRVEAWDKDVKYHDLLGSSITNADGGFEMSFDSTYFREFAPEDKPDIFFKVYAGKRLVKSTEEAPIKNAPQQVEVTIVVDMHQYFQPEGQDRVSTEQIFKIATFLHDSDFKGVYSDFKKKAGTTVGHVSDMVLNTINKFDFEPIRTAPIKEEEIMHQEVGDVKKNLESKEIKVGEVREYNPKMNVASLKSMRILPKNIKPGQRVNLYQENGTVKYYTLENEKAAKEEYVNINDSFKEKKTEEVVDLQNEVSKLKMQLEQVQGTHQKEISLRDEQIKELQKSVTQFDKFSSDFESLRKQVGQMAKTPKKPTRKKDDK